jgi:pilus assembly protein CpaC
MKSIIYLLNFIFFCLVSVNAIAQIDPANVGTDVSSSDPKVSDVATDGSEDEVKIPSMKHKDKPRRTTYRKSRYTSDRTENEADHVDLTLAMGIDKIINIDYEGELRAANFYVGNTAVAVVQPVLIGKTKKEMVIKPVGEGETTITVRDAKGNVPVIFKVIVAKQNIVRLLGVLKKNLQEVEGINIQIEGSRIVLSGEVITLKDFGQVTNVVSDRTFADVVSNRIRLSPVTMNELAKKIQSDVQVFAPNVQVRMLNGRLLLEGTVDSEGAKILVARRAELYFPEGSYIEPENKAPDYIQLNAKPLQLIQNLLVVQAPPPKRDAKLVRVTVHFVELSKDFLKSFGFKWQPGFTADPSISIGSSAATGATSTSAAGGFTFAGTLSSLFPALNSAQSAGYGRILKSATMVGKSGEEITAKDTITIPTISVGPNGQQGVAAGPEVGFTLAVTPTILAEKDVDLNVNIDQTNVVSKGQNGATITANHKIKTRVYLKSGEVAGLANINKQEISTAFNRDDPNPGSFAQGQGAPTRPLWNMTRSKNFSKNKGEVVIFVSPQIIENASEGTEDMKKNYRIKSGSSD